MGKLTEYSYFPVTVAYIIYAGVTSYILFQLFKSDWGDIFKRPAFWISSALLAISSCNIIYVAFQDIINAYELVWPWVLHNIVNMIAYLMYAVGLYVSKCGAEESEMEISDAFPLLTSQQRKVYWRTKKGITREDDAKIFDINAVTVRKHIENIRRKLSSAKLEDPNP
ncbi:MAG: helix-turn-helix transcriptional regulator [candidate division Zixibacteria bacterium]|nr:helix-turn-helix transcriptional regulator [candidate division Zixibacteria bacterium]